MKKSLFIGFLSIASLSQTYNAYADYSIAEKEIRSASPITFESYVGRPRIVNTRNQVKNIGSFLAQTDDNELLTYADKYSIRKIRSESQDVFSADIFSLLDNARANRIQDIRLMLSGYLESSYGYSSTEGLALSAFITYYNGIYRNNIDYVKEHYDNKILDYISEDQMGIAKNYKDWKGQTAILIPLSNNTGAINSLELGNEDIKNALKQEDGKGVEEREAINELQNQQVKEEQSTLKEEKEVLEEQTEILEQKEKDLEKQKQLANTKEEKEKIDKEIAKNQQEKEALEKQQEDIAKKESILQEQEKTVKADKEDIKSDKKQTQSNVKDNTSSNNKPKINNTDNSKNNQKTEKKDQKPTKIPDAKEVAKIIENQKIEVENAQEKEKSGLLYYLKKVGYYNGTYKDSQLITIETESKKNHNSSQLATISGNQFDILDTGVIVIARENPKSDVSHLTLLDMESLEITKVGEENIFSTGILRIDGSSIYTIYQKDESYYLGVFNIDLQLEKNSFIVVDKDTFITFYEDKIFITREDGKIISLNKEDLTLDAEIS